MQFCRLFIRYSQIMIKDHIFSLWYNAEFSFGGLHFEKMSISLQASSWNSNWDPSAAGSIGIQLIQEFNFTINLVEKEIYLVRNNKK